ncbi:MAG: SRPBCC domain-containing protein [Algicola sp.]|nr:SRPBCC domain-containing protein [Algicola sp.]
MKKVQFHIDINAPANKVYNYMLGLDNKSTYEAWTAVFNPTSTYEGSWDEGAKILFVGTDEHGKKGGMVSKIEKNTPNVLVSIKHYGILDGDNEITEGEAIEAWAGGLETYYFSETNGITKVTVEMDTLEDYIDFFNDTLPKALNILKNTCENE